MKKLMTFILILTCIALIICIYEFASCTKRNKNNEDNQPEETVCEINYVIDGDLHSTSTASVGEILTAPSIEEKSGYTFKGWYTTDEYVLEWNFATETVKSNLSLFGYWVKSEEETFNVFFTDEDNLIECIKVSNGCPVTEISAPEKEGYTFAEWRDGEEKYDFTAPVISDLTLNATWDINVYTVSFNVGEDCIDKINFTVENMQISEPEVPSKQYYTAEWETYCLSLNDIEVNAVYTPIIYTASIIIDDLNEEIKYTVEDFVILPDIPEKNGYTSSWDELLPEGGDFTIKAIYTPITYYVYYKVDGEIIKICEYTVESYSVSAPDIPEKDGFESSWEQKDYETGDVTINAVYSMLIYKADFIIDGIIINTQYFQSDNMSVDEPTIPARTGYSAYWEEYLLDYKDIEIKAVYSPIVYTAYLIVGENVYDSINFTVEDTILLLPSVPEKQGFDASWENYVITANDLLIEAVYAPIIYIATFIAEENVIARIPFTVENYDIAVPVPPKKSGYTAKWSDFSLTLNDITVYAIYEIIAVDGGWDESDNFEYEINTDGSLTVSKYTGNAVNPVIPAYHDGLPVKSIGAQAFSGMNICSVRLCEGIELIQRDAFLTCKNLTTVILPESLKAIEQYAFAYCSFTEIELPEGLTEIGTQAFYGCKLKSIKIPDSLIVLEDVFWFCNDLQCVTLGKNLEIISSNAFCYCSSLTDIYFGEKLKTICSNAFNNCPALEHITIPESVTLIEPEAFLNCANLTEVHFEASENWIICNENDVPVHDIDLTRISDDKTAAIWLTDLYASRYWKRNNSY